MIDWPTQDLMMYRLMRLRRLVAVSAAIPLVVILVGVWIDPSFITAERAALVAIAATMFMAGHVMIFPNATVETLCLSIGISGLIVAAPWIRHYAHMAPEEHVSSALFLMTCLTVVFTGFCVAALRSGLGLLIYAGPAVPRKLSASMDLPCSARTARMQFALAPRTRRGRIMTGDADPNGFFDVAILVPQVVDPRNPKQMMVAHVAAKVLHQSDTTHDVMLVLQDGSVTVTSERFVPTEQGCRIEISELPGDFTYGMYAIFWLSDQQMDNLQETADIITGTPARANGLAHGECLMNLAAAVFMPYPPAQPRTK